MLERALYCLIVVSGEMVFGLVFIYKVFFDGFKDEIYEVVGENFCFTLMPKWRE